MFGFPHLPTTCRVEHGCGFGRPSAKRYGDIIDVRACVRVRACVQCAQLQILYHRRLFSGAALYAVRDHTAIVAEWEDDAVFALGERPKFTYFDHIYDVSFMGVSAPSAIAIIICSLLLALSTASEIRQIRVAYLVVQQLLNPVHGESSIAPAPWRLAAAGLMHYTRLVALFQFVSSSLVLLGTGDGPMNIMLNALAVTFILDVDDMIVDGFSDMVPSSGRERHDLTAASGDVARLLAASPLKAMLSLAQTVVLIATFVALSLSAMVMQQATSAGKPFAIERDGPVHDLFLADDASRFAVTARSAMRSIGFIVGVVSAVLSNAALAPPAGARHPSFWRRIILSSVIEGAALFLYYWAVQEFIIRKFFVHWSTPGKLADRIAPSGNSTGWEGWDPLYGSF